MADVTIREATPDDVDGILRVAERGWNAAYNDSLSQETIDTAVSEWYDADAIRELVGRGDAAYFVAEDAGSIELSDRYVQTAIPPTRLLTNPESTVRGSVEHRYP